jgi:hypothetical protein
LALHHREVRSAVRVKISGLHGDWARYGGDAAPGRQVRSREDGDAEDGWADRIAIYPVLAHQVLRDWQILDAVAVQSPTAMAVASETSGIGKRRRLIEDYWLPTTDCQLPTVACGITFSGVCV